MHVKNFPVKLFPWEKPRHLTIDVGTEDISTNIRGNYKSIVKLALSEKSNTSDVTLSGITARNDRHQQSATLRNYANKIIFF